MSVRAPRPEACVGGGGKRERERERETEREGEKKKRKDKKTASERWTKTKLSSLNPKKTLSE